jgi:diguanylate cyclase (GGDEF)-like protein
MQVFTAFVQFLLAVAVSFGVLVLIASFLRFQFMTADDRRTTEADVAPDERFHLEIVKHLGTAHKEPEPFSLLLVRFEGLTDHGADVEKDVLDRAVDVVRGVLRTTDFVIPYHEHTLGILVETHVAFIGGIVERVMKALEAMQYKDAAGRAMVLKPVLGAVAMPENGNRLDALLEALVDAMERAGEALNGRFLAMPPEEPPTEEDNAAAGRSDLIDPLTGVLRSDKLPRAMPKYLARYRREGQSVSLLYIDIDYLSRYNEHYGKEAGDTLLRGVGEFLQDTLREDDLIARHGGEEFVVLLPCEAEDGERVGARLAAGVRKHTFEYAGKHLKLSLSIGVAACPRHGRRPQQLFDAAEKALEGAKEKGRGVCVLYDAGGSEEKHKTGTADRF